ncbi:MAG: alpha/beta hydrolase, partial [Bacteroidota bacterium]|nr:alpha/beta hydrolase [Bacteroidota bacterium]
VCLTLLAASAALAQQPIVYGANPEAGHYAHVNDIRLYYETYGSGHPLLLMHGNGGWINDLRFQIAEFAKYFKVIAVDSRAQGLSTVSDQELSFSLMASDVAQLLDSLHIDSAYVLGWSDGGIVGLELALKYPAKVAKLVTVGANYVPDSTALPAKMIEEMRNSSFAKLDSATQQDIIAHSHFPQRAGLIYDKLNRLDLLHPHIMLEQLHSIKAPTLVMAGDHDIIIATHTLSLFHALPHAELCIVPGAGHGLLLTRAPLANEIIKNFLQKK